MPARRFLSTVAVTTNLAINAVAIAMAVAQRWAAGFGATPDPNHVADQWAGTGTAISAPLAVLVALLLLPVLALLPWRSARIIGCAGSILVGLIFVLGLGAAARWRLRSCYGR